MKALANISGIKETARLSSSMYNVMMSLVVSKPLESVDKQVSGEEEVKSSEPQVLASVLGHGFLEECKMICVYVYMCTCVLCVCVCVCVCVCMWCVCV